MRHWFAQTDMIRCNSTNCSLQASAPIQPSVRGTNSLFKLDFSNLMLNFLFVKCFLAPGHPNCIFHQKTTPERMRIFVAANRYFLFRVFFPCRSILFAARVFVTLRIFRAFERIIRPEKYHAAMWVFGAAGIFGTAGNDFSDCQFFPQRCRARQR